MESHSSLIIVSFKIFRRNGLLFLDSISLPNIIREALSHPGWHSAMVDEMQALDDNGT